jgi:hypothetical protein
MNEVTLKNGAREAQVVVNSCLGLLKSMDALCFGALHALCENPRANISESRKQQLMKMSALDANGQVSNSMRNVVLSAMIDASWEGATFTLGNPVV